MQIILIVNNFNLSDFVFSLSKRNNVDDEDLDHIWEIQKWTNDVVWIPSPEPALNEQVVVSKQKLHSCFDKVTSRTNRVS